MILKDHRAENAPRSFDILGIVLLSGAMFCLVWALIKAADVGLGRRQDAGRFLAGSRGLLRALRLLGDQGPRSR